jgi:thioredoxin-related protein
MQKVTLLYLLAFSWLYAYQSVQGRGGEHWSLTATLHVKEQVRWLTLKEAEKRLETERKPVLIDLYTDWCGWCKVMDKQTYSHDEVVKYINEHFIPVKLDAETKEVLSWKGKSFRYDQNYRVNSYALFLTGGQLSFPTTVFLPADGSEPQPVPGFLEPKDIEVILKYFGEGQYGKTPFKEYFKNFFTSWK